MSQTNSGKGLPPLHVVTPLIESTEMKGLCGGVPVLLKLENTQPSGSFKIRGIGNLVQKKAMDGSSGGVVSSSGGNAGLAAAYAARRVGVPATVVVPQSTPAMMRNKLEREGALVNVHGAVWDEANKKALQLVKDEGRVYVHPFEHPLIWEGVSSLVGEVVQQCDGVTPSCVVLSVGGGGLLCGVLQGLMDKGLESVPVVAMETEGAHCLNAALAAGKPVSIGNITSLAKSLGALTVTSRVFELLQRCTVVSRLVTDAQAVDACCRFAEDHRYLVEPSCGAALAAVYSGLLQKLFSEGVVKGSGPAVVVVCGGNAVSVDMLRQWRKQAGLTDDWGQ